MKKFSIVYYLEGEIRDKVRDLQYKISELSGARSSIVEWEPHITVGDAPEFSDDALEKLERELDLFCKKNNSFDVLLEGFGGVNNRLGGNGEKTTSCVLWINVIVNENLSALVSSLKIITDHYDKWYRMPTPYRPHCTLAFRDLNQEGYEKGMQFLEGKLFKENLFVNHIALVEHLSDKDVEYKRFYLNI